MSDNNNLKFILGSQALLAALPCFAGELLLTLLSTNWLLE